MITIRQMVEEDIESISQDEELKVWSQEDYKKTQTYLVVDRKTILGIASYDVLTDHQAQLLCLYIKKEYQGNHFGDGLFRAILNHLDKQEFSKVYCSGDHNMKPFYDKEELEQMSSEQLELSVKNKWKGTVPSLIFEVKLPDFFEGPCKSERGLI